METIINNPEWAVPVSLTIASASAWLAFKYPASFWRLIGYPIAFVLMVVASLFIGIRMGAISSGSKFMLSQVDRLECTDEIHLDLAKKTAGQLRDDIELLATGSVFFFGLIMFFLILCWLPTALERRR